MDPESYPIEILHFLNPHLIWIERKDKSPDIVFEQIGIFGLLPLKKVIGNTGEVLVKKSETWVLAINAVMRDFFQTNTEFYFLPTHIDRRSSIFNDNIHKFGDIYILQDNQQKISLSTLLVNSGFAEQNECEFYTKLYSGNIKTKLNTIESDKVVTAIQDHFTVKHSETKNKAVKKNTTITRAIKEFGNALTDKNLEIHNRNENLIQFSNVSEIIEKKTRDFLMCKEENEVPIGRGCSRLSDNVSEASKTTSKSQNSVSKYDLPQSSMGKIQKADPMEVCKKVEELSIRSLSIHNSKYENKNTSSLHQSDRVITKDSLSASDRSANITRTSDNIVKQDTDEDVLAVITSNIRLRNHPKKQYVAFGPPMNDIVNYKIKPQNEAMTSEETVNKSEEILKKYGQEAKKEQEVNKVNRDEFDDTWDDEVVSNLGVKITNIDKKEQEVNKVNRDEFDDTWDGEADSNLDVKITNIDKLKIVVDSNAGNNDSFKRKNEGKTDIVNQIDNENSNVSITDNKVTENTKIDAENTSERFKKLKDRLGKIHTDVNMIDNNVEPDRSESFKKLKHRIQSNSKVNSPNVDVNKIEDTGASSSNSSTLGESENVIKSNYLKKIIKMKEIRASQSTSTDFDKSRESSTNNTNETDTDEEIEEIKAKLISENGTIEFKPKNDKNDEKLTENSEKIERNVNPYKNLDYSKSVFVDKLVSPILMVHTKNDIVILPHSSLREVPFKNDIKHTLKKMSVKEPSRLQSVSWYYILKGHSVFMIGPAGSGKTLGYIPAVCNNVMDDLKEIVSNGPICIIVCATASSVCKIASTCKLFLGLDEKVLACYHGINMTDLTTSVLNGCEILVCTPSILLKLLMMELGVDLRRLSTLVLDDCERLSVVYEPELKAIQYYVKKMYKNRANKSFKVQYIVASRLWCDFMRPLAKKAPSSIVSIVAFQECVLYSKASTSVEFFLQDGKVNSVKEFLKQIDRSKRTVIVCRTDEEVESLQNALSYHKSLFVCDDKMTLHDVHDMNIAWSNYKEPILGPILLCCDGNLTLLNVTDAHYLVHFSMPELFSMFCKRFAVLNDNYASIFNENANDVKIKIMLDENNVEQLPKILNFIKRCTSEVPKALEEFSGKVLEQKDYHKGEKLVPLCDSMLSLSQCSDFWNCRERHAILKEFDEPKDWMPRDGVITFKILHFDTPVTYSAKLLSHTTKSEIKNYPTNYSMLSLKMGMYFSKESNRKLHGIPKIGDICAVAAKPNFYTRCKVLKIVSYAKGNPHVILIKLIDEEKMETVKDIYLYHLPEEFKKIETHVVKVRLANIQPQDKDVTYSDLAKYQVKKIIESDEHLYLRGEVVLTVGNTIFVNTLEACQDLVSLNETVVKHNLKMELLESHAKLNPDHVTKLKKLCQIGGLEVEFDKPLMVDDQIKVERNYRWAYLPKDEFVQVVFAGASDPSKFFVVLTKFEKCVRLLVRDIQKYVEENTKRLESFEVGDVVLAEFPDDNTYERARIQEILDNKVFCFFVDRGDMRDVSINKIKYLPNNLIEQLPFQVIECRLIGVQPPATEWSEFSINWLCDMCLESREDAKKIIYLKYFTREVAEFTGGNKYGVLLIDTNTDKDLNINKMMIELNLAREIEEEVRYLDEPIVFESEKEGDDDLSLNDNPENTANGNSDKSVVPLNITNDSESDNEVKPSSIFPGRLIRSVPLVDENISDDDIDLNLSDDLVKAFGLNNFIGSRILNNVSDTTSRTSENSSQTTVKTVLPKIKNGSITDDNIPSPTKDSKICSDNNKSIEKELNHSLNGNEGQQNNSKSYTDIKELSHDSIDGNNIDSIKLEAAKNITNTEDVSTNSSKKSSPIKRRGSLDDPKIVLDIEHLTPTKSNVFNMFAKSKFGNVVDDLKLPNVQTSKSHLDFEVKTDKSELDSDDLSSTDVSQDTEKKFTEMEPPRIPKLIWRQNKNSVTIKIQLIGVETYNLEIQAQAILFDCDCNDTPYEFKIDLYGCVNVKNSKHANKGQYIQVNLEKILKKNWINLTRDGKIKKWIVYDVDGIDASSDEEVEEDPDGLEALKKHCENQESDSDDDFDDDFDMSFAYGQTKKTRIQATKNSNNSQFLPILTFRSSLFVDLGAIQKPTHLPNKTVSQPCSDMMFGDAVTSRQASILDHCIAYHQAVVKNSSKSYMYV